MDFHVRRVPAEKTWVLRQTVLRPHEAVGDMSLPDDDDPTTAALAAVDEKGEVLGTARVAIAGPPLLIESFIPHNALTWQLRGMATRKDVRSRGIGKEVLEGVIAHVAENGGGFLWCNARLPALDFYRRAEFVEHGEVWIEPHIGPHVVMWRLVKSNDSSDGDANLSR